MVVLMLWCRWAAGEGCNNGRWIVMTDDLRAVAAEGELRRRRSELHWDCAVRY